MLAAVVAPAAGWGLIDPARGRANDAWTQRLDGQADQIRAAERRRELAHAAWSQRLAAQAEAYAHRKANAERASRAWTDRLNGLADYLGVTR